MRRICFVLALCAAATAASAQTVTFNFDTAPGGGSIASGTVLNTIYQSQGLTLSLAGPATLCASGNIYANNDRPADFTISSSPNVVSQCPPPTASDVSEPNFGAIRASFATTASQVCINVRPDTGTDRAVLRVYDGVGTLLNSATSAAGATQQLCVAASGIRRAEFSGASGTFVRLDDLVVTFSAAPPPPPPPPPTAAPIPALAPALLVALAAGLGLLGVRASRRR